MHKMVITEANHIELNMSTIIYTTITDLSIISAFQLFMMKIEEYSPSTIFWQTEDTQYFLKYRKK